MPLKQYSSSFFFFFYIWEANYSKFSGYSYVKEMLFPRLCFEACLCSAVCVEVSDLFSIPWRNYSKLGFHFTFIFLSRSLKGHGKFHILYKKHVSYNMLKLQNIVSEEIIEEKDDTSYHLRGLAVR